MVSNSHPRLHFRLEGRRIPTGQIFIPSGQKWPTGYGMRMHNVRETEDLFQRLLAYLHELQFLTKMNVVCLEKEGLQTDSFEEASEVRGWTVYLPGCRVCWRWHCSIHQHRHRYRPGDQYQGCSGRGQVPGRAHGVDRVKLSSSFKGNNNPYTRGSRASGLTCSVNEQLHRLHFLIAGRICH